MSATLNDLLVESAARWPAREALARADAADSALSFGELGNLVARGARGLSAAGIRRGDRVALLHRNDPLFVIAYLALTRLGAVCVPLNFLIRDPGEIRRTLDHCGAKAAVAQKEFLPGLMAARRSLPFLSRIWTTGGEPPPPCEDFSGLLARAPAGARSSRTPGVQPGDRACILYTSGTTGEPKGVMLTHSNLLSNCAAFVRAAGIGPSDVILGLLPMFHTFAWTACALAGLRAGAKTVLAASSSPAESWLEAMGRHGVTVMVAVPAVYGLLSSDRGGMPRLRDKHRPLGKLRVCVSGAAPLRLPTVEACARVFPVPLRESYGLTETSPVATLNPARAIRPGSVGLPLPGVKLKIIAESGEDLPPGSEGEVCIRGPNVMQGYYRDPEATALALDPDGWLKTGDIGALDEEGYLFLRDRKKDLINVKGLKVYPAQIEAVLLSHPAVAEAAAVGMPGADGDERILAFVVAKEGAAPEKAGLLRFCRERLDPFRRPRDIRFVESLPKNALQKVLRRSLRAEFSAPP